MTKLLHFAHSHKERPKSDWHLLAEHLESTAARAERFASPFAKGWGYLAGLLHDAGKYQRSFQDYLSAAGEHTNQKIDHSSVGALIALSKRAAALVFVIAGHHAGLADREDLRGRLETKADLLRQARASGLPAILEDFTKPAEPDDLSATAKALWIRFLFSALVDADYLDTEHFFQGVERDPTPADLPSLSRRLDAYLDRKISESALTTVNLLRARVLEECRAAATLPQGLFTFTVPTGGGKTLSSLSFALRHAVKHNLRRVIFVVPFTSIIDQTAQVYREILGEDVVIEHHSNLDPDRETVANQTACENWDSGIIVTTSVQFFESLYANRTSRCRKLHRIAHSIVVFDEVQTFEPTLLEPIKEVLRNLVRHFGVSAVFCTATQPTLELGAVEIVHDPPRLFELVRDRCRIRMPASAEPIAWQEIAAEVRIEHQALVIVDRRADAEQLARLLGVLCIHLSARMCPVHRLATIFRIKALLKSGERCLVVSTQLVEAGVDIDFPVVYRAFAGAGSLAQAAGRCNREGTRAEGGELRIFFPVKPPPPGILRIGAQRAEAMWKEGHLDLEDPTTFSEYYRRLYNSVEVDPEGILAAERELRFRYSAEHFKMIADSGVQVVAPFGNSEEKVRDIENSGISRRAMRRLQPFLVTLYPQEVELLRKAGSISPTVEGCDIWRVLPQFKHVYDERFGFQWQGPLAADPEALIG